MTTGTQAQIEAYARLVEMRNQPDPVYVYVTEHEGRNRKLVRFTGVDLDAMVREAVYFPGIVAIERIDTPGVAVWTKGQEP